MILAIIMRMGLQVSKQRMNEYNMAKRRLKSLESQGVQVLALKQKDVEVAKAALASLGEDDDDEYFATGKNKIEESVGLQFNYFRLILHTLLIFNTGIC